MLKSVFVKILFAFLLVFFPFLTFAQIRSSDVSISVSPENPTAGEEATATLTSYLFDLNTAYITWLKNDELITEGVGKKSFVFNAGEFNTDVTITARISLTSGETLIKNFTVTPTEIDLIWESTNSYTPPFYKGKTLIAQEGTFKVVAMPNVYVLGSKANPQNMSYKWTLDGNVSQEGSGWAKNSFSFKNSYLDKQNEIEVEATDLLGKVKSYGTATLPTFDPKIVFYKKIPQYGISLNNAILNSYDLPKEGDTFTAVPYFFSPKDIKNNNLSVTWEIDQKDISTPASKFDISLKGKDGETGNSLVKIIVNNTKTLFQELDASIQVNF